jgi:CheY-like chemotaxis protein
MVIACRMRSELRMRVLYVSHTEDCFLTPLSDLPYELDKFVDHRSLAEIFAGDEKVDPAQYDLCLIHPEDPSDEGYAEAPCPCILMSYDYRPELDEWVVADQVVRMSSDLVRRHWSAILREFEFERGDLPYAIQGALCTVQGEAVAESPPSLGNDRHKIANREGPRWLVGIAGEKGGVSRAFAEDVAGKLRRLEKKLVVPTQEEVCAPLPAPPAEGDLFPAGRVLLIDDEHRRGWSTVFGGLLDLEVHDVQRPGDLRDGPGLFALEKVGESKDPSDLAHAWNLLGLTSDVRPCALPFDLVLADYRLKDEDPAHHEPVEVTGTHLISQLHRLDPSLPVIVVTASESYKTHRQLSRYNIIGYYVKPHNRPDDRVEYDNFVDMMSFVKSHSHLRDLWEMVVWIDNEKPRVWPAFRDPDVLAGLSSMDAPGPIEPAGGDRQVRERLLDALVPAVTFLFREQREIMVPSRLAVDDGDRIGPIDIRVWSMFRTSHASDRLIGDHRAHDRLEELFEGDPVWVYASYVCRVLRNLVAHGMPEFLGPIDLLLQMLCILKIAFRDPVPDERIRRLVDRYANTAPLPLDPLFATYAHRLARDEADVPSDGVARREWLRSSIKKLSRKKTSKLLLYGCYLGLLEAILEGDASQKGWGYLVSSLIEKALERHTPAERPFI